MHVKHETQFCALLFAKDPRGVVSMSQLKSKPQACERPQLPQKCDALYLSVLPTLQPFPWQIYGHTKVLKAKVTLM